MRKLHLIQQRKRRPYIRTVHKRTTAAIDHDIRILWQLAQPLPQLVDIVAIPRRPDVDRSPDDSTRANTKNDRLFHRRIANGLRKLSRRKQLLRFPGLLIHRPERQSRENRHHNRAGNKKQCTFHKPNIAQNPRSARCRKAPVATACQSLPGLCHCKVSAPTKSQSPLCLSSPDVYCSSQQYCPYAQ